jgi:replication factor C small subunit
MTGLENIWTEKYRPKKLEDVIGQNHVVSSLRSFVSTRSLPHCLFTGPAGCGKTTTALCIANEFFHDQWKSNFLELNASDERGIETVRVKVKDFARTMPIGGLFKIVYLDEADALTKDAQHALRRTMELYSNTCRFILACNYSGKIIPPIQSRTAIFRFSSLKEEDIVNYLEYIAKAEKLNIEKGVLQLIFKFSNGDLRKAINILQTASTSGRITSDVILSVTSKMEPVLVQKMLSSSLSGNFSEARKQLLSLLYEKGIAGEDIIRDIHSQIFSLDLTDSQRLSIIEKTGECEFRLTEGSNPQIQLESLLAQIALIGKKQ